MKSIISFAALAVTTLALQSYRAEAQDSTSSSGSTSSSSSSSGSVSGSRSGASTTSGTSGNQQRTNQRVNTTSNTNIPITFNSADPAGANGANGTNGGGSASGSNTPGGSTGQPYYGQSDVTIRSAPPVYAPNVQGGNPCTVGYSVGVSWIGAGVAGGMTTVDEDCANRQKIAMIHNAGYAGAAKELMCNDKATYFAFRSSGQPCVPRAQFDGGPGAPAPPPMVQQQPVPIAPPPQQMVTKDRTTLPRCSRTITDNCWGG